MDRVSPDYFCLRGRNHSWELHCRGVTLHDVVSVPEESGLGSFAFQLNYYFPGEEQGEPEKPSVFTSELQMISTLRAAPASLSSSPPTHSTNFHSGKRCGEKQTRERQRSVKPLEPPGCRTPASSHPNAEIQLPPLGAGASGTPEQEGSPTPGTVFYPNRRAKHSGGPGPHRGRCPSSQGSSQHPCQQVAPAGKGGSGARGGERQVAETKGRKIKRCEKELTKKMNP